MLHLSRTNEAVCKDLGGKVVRQLLQPLQCEGRNVTTENYFTSLVLARDLLKAKKATLIGTIRTNRVELPKEFAAPAGRELYSSLVGFNETGDSSFAHRRSTLSRRAFSVAGPMAWNATSETRRSVPTISIRSSRRICFGMHLDT